METAIRKCGLRALGPAEIDMQCMKRRMQKGSAGLRSQFKKAE
ncbi:hypothetical protein [Comamonas testosteroni]|jgi:hypothetical protein|nr:hypothetical protein [Comamonas testosteroni]